MSLVNGQKKKMLGFKRILILNENNIYYIIYDVSIIPFYPAIFYYYPENGKKMTFYLQKSNSKYGLYAP